MNSPAEEDDSAVQRPTSFEPSAFQVARLSPIWIDPPGVDRQIILWYTRSDGEDRVVCVNGGIATFMTAHELTLFLAEVPSGIGPEVAGRAARLLEVTGGDLSGVDLAEFDLGLLHNWGLGQESIESVERAGTLLDVINLLSDCHRTLEEYRGLGPWPPALDAAANTLSEVVMFGTMGPEEAERLIREHGQAAVLAQEVEVILSHLQPDHS